MSNVVQYLFANRGVGMPSGKLAAQIGHASVESYIISNPKLIKRWRLGGHYTKLVMLARDTNDLRTIQQYIEDRGFKTKLIIDEGLTEIPKFTPTALGVEIVDKEDPHVLATFSSFELYRDKPKLQHKLKKVIKRTIYGRRRRTRTTQEAR
jgi:peptidyl-tRNA hydrolase